MCDVFRRRTSSLSHHGHDHIPRMLAKRGYQSYCPYPRADARTRPRPSKALLRRTHSYGEQRPPFGTHHEEVWRKSSCKMQKIGVVHTPRMALRAWVERPGSESCGFVRTEPRDGLDPGLRSPSRVQRGIHYSDFLHPRPRGARRDGRWHLIGPAGAGDEASGRARTLRPRMSRRPPPPDPAPVRASGTPLPQTLRLHPFRRPSPRKPYVCARFRTIEAPQRVVSIGFAQTRPREALQT